MALNETQIRINEILAKGTYLIVGVDPKGKEKLKIHVCNIPMDIARRIILNLAVDAAHTDANARRDFMSAAYQVASIDDLSKRDFLAAAVSISQQLQDEEAVANEIIRPH